MYGSKIASIRLARGYSQEYVASRLGIAQNTYSKIEKDESRKLDESLLESIAAVLGVSTEDIKSPTPIIMNFHDHSQGGHYSTNYQSDERVINALLEQLQRKDEQLAQKDAMILQLMAQLGK